MLNITEALQIILESKLTANTELVDITNCTGRVLAEKVMADRDFPPFDRVCMDGIAIDYSAYEKGIRKFISEDMQAAGSPQMKLQAGEHCIEVMTGAVLPEGTTTVIPYEVLSRNDDAFEVIPQIRDKSNIHYKGKDAKAHDVLIDEHRIITAAEIGVLATIGKKTIKVFSLPKVAIVSTGDELVDVDQIPKAYQIRRSNNYSLKSMLEEFKIEADMYHFQDNDVSIRTQIESMIENYQAILISGGVSKGKLDLLPGIFEEIGVSKLFHGVRQRPGKPFWFGRKGEARIFAFPGNPVSTFVCAMAYLRPWMQASFSLPSGNDRFIVRLAEEVEFKPDLHYFAPAILEQEGNELKARVVKGDGSGDLSNLLKVDGFVELPMGQELFRTDQNFNFIHFRKF